MGQRTIVQLGRRAAPDFLEPGRPEGAALSALYYPGSSGQWAFFGILQSESFLLESFKRPRRLPTPSGHWAGKWAFS